MHSTMDVYLTFFFLQVHYYNADIEFCYTFLTVLIDLEIVVLASVENSPSGAANFYTQVIH